MSGYNPSVIEPIANQPLNDGGATLTVMVTSNPVSTPGPNATVTISGLITGTPGTGATRASVLIYRGTPTAGVYVRQVDSEVTAGDFYCIPIIGIDQPGELAGQTYTLSIRMTGATALGTIEDAIIGGIVS